MAINDNDSGIQVIGDGGADGVSVGGSATDKVSFYGVTPVAQRAGAVQASSLVSASTYMTLQSNLSAWQLEVTNTLVALGIWKGAV